MGGGQREEEEACARFGNGATDSGLPLSSACARSTCTRGGVDGALLFSLTACEGCARPNTLLSYEVNSWGESQKMSTG